MSKTEVAQTKSIAAKPAKEKKATKVAAAPKEKKKPNTSSKASPPSHPPYFQMIKEAIQSLKERTGSSPYAIAKHIEEQHKGVLPANFKKMLGVRLKSLVAKGKLVKVKASFKVADSGKTEEKKAVTKKPVVEKKEKAKVGGTKRKAPETEKKEKKKVKTTPKKKAVKKPVVVKKKATPVKARVKQPKTIKSPAKGKRAKKATA